MRDEMRHHASSIPASCACLKSAAVPSSTFRQRCLGPGFGQNMDGWAQHPPALALGQSSDPMADVCTSSCHVCFQVGILLWDVEKVVLVQGESYKGLG